MQSLLTKTKFLSKSQQATSSLTVLHAAVRAAVPELGIFRHMWYLTLSFEEIPRQWKDFLLSSYAFFRFVFLKVMLCFASRSQPSLATLKMFRLTKAGDMKWGFGGILPRIFRAFESKMSDNTERQL